jgi:hypothetical protein
MTPDDFNWRPITFQGIVFPPTVMAISTLDSILEMDDQLGEWLWRFPICCGITKSAPADRCEQFARQLVDLMLQHPERVLAGIHSELGEFGFDADATYHAWLAALRQIESLSRLATNECRWSAPSHPRDPLQNQSDFERFATAFNRVNPRHK